VNVGDVVAGPGEVGDVDLGLRAARQQRHGRRHDAEGRQRIQEGATADPAAAQPADEIIRLHDVASSVAAFLGNGRAVIAWAALVLAASAL